MRKVWLGILLFIWVFGAAILFWPTSKDPLSVDSYVEELSEDSARITGPVLYTICDIPIMMVEPDGDGIIHYEGDSLQERLNDNSGSPIITNELVDGIGMECQRIDAPLDNETTPYRREPVPNINDHMKQWSA